MVKPSSTESVPEQSLPCSFAPVTPVVNVAQPQQGRLSSENAGRGCFHWSSFSIMPLLYEVWIVSWLCSIRTPELTIPSPCSCQNLILLLPLSGQMEPGKERLLQSPLLHWWLFLSLQLLSCPNLHSEPELPKSEEFFKIVKTFFPCYLLLNHSLITQKLQPTCSFKSPKGFNKLWTWVGGRHWLCSVLKFTYTSTAVWSVLSCPQVL